MRWQTRAAIAIAGSMTLAGVASCGPSSSSRESAVPGTPITPVPAELAETAGKFGLTMLADGFTWTAIDPKATRFEWSGRSASGDRELLYSFWRPKLDATERKFLTQLVASAAANLAEGRPCAPLEQPIDFVKILGVDRVISVCFVPSVSYAKEFHYGIMHGIVNDDALTLVAVLSNDRAAAVVPLPKSIGARGK